MYSVMGNVRMLPNRAQVTYSDNCFTVMSNKSLSHSSQSQIVKLSVKVLWIFNVLKSGRKSDMLVYVKLLLESKVSYPSKRPRNLWKE